MNKKSIIIGVLVLILLGGIIYFSVRGDLFKDTQTEKEAYIEPSKEMDISLDTKQQLIAHIKSIEDFDEKMSAITFSLSEGLLTDDDVEAIVKEQDLGAVMLTSEYPTVDGKQQLIDKIKSVADEEERESMIKFALENELLTEEEVTVLK